jgi:hypothetical protein
MEAANGWMDASSHGRPGLHSRGTNLPPASHDRWPGPARQWPMSGIASPGPNTGPDAARRRRERLRAVTLAVVIVVAAGVVVAIATGAFWQIPALR